MIGTGARQERPVDDGYGGFPVLYVDDEPSNLRSFQLLFEGRFEIVTASNGGEALASLEARPVAVLLADQRLGTGMPGSELCAAARERYPEVVRMIVTAYADNAATIDGINRGQVSRYISKPWKKHDMESALRAGIDEYYARAFTRQTQELVLGRQQQAAAAVVVGRVLRWICNPVAAAHMNLACAGGALDSLEPMIAAMSAALTAAGQAPPPCGATFRELRGMVADASEAVTELVGQIERLRQGEAPARAAPGETNLDHVLRAALAPMRGELGRRASLVLELGAEPRVAVEPSTAGQIVLNLLPAVLAACHPGQASENRVVVASFVSRDGRGGFSIRHPAAARAAERAGTGGRLRGAHDPGRLALGIVRALVDAAGGRFAMLDPGDGQRELRIDLPLARR